jgi:hypothetical protein
MTFAPLLPLYVFLPLVYQYIHYGNVKICAARQKDHKLSIYGAPTGLRVQSEGGSIMVVQNAQNRTLNRERILTIL